VSSEAVITGETRVEGPAESTEDGDGNGTLGTLSAFLGGSELIFLSFFRPDLPGPKPLEFLSS
jgi:hypothetical protein